MLKSTLKKFCYDTERDWDEGVPYVLYAVRNAKQESLGFIPTELVFGHSVRGPLKVLKEQLVSGSLPKVNILDFVSQNRERLHRATSLAKKALDLAQGMKQRFDRKTVERQFKPGEQVLVLLPVPGAALYYCFFRTLCGGKQCQKLITSFTHVTVKERNACVTLIC